MASEQPYGQVSRVFKEAFSSYRNIPTAWSACPSWLSPDAPKLSDLVTARAA